MCGKFGRYGRATGAVGSLALLGAVLASGCRFEFERAGASEHSTSVAGENGFATGGSGVDDPSGPGASAGASEGVQVVALRFVVVDKERNELGTQVRSLWFEGPAGRLPSRPLDSAAMEVLLLTDADSEPWLAFDDDPETWFATSEELMPQFLELQLPRAIEPPTRVFVDLHQHSLRAPSEFRFEAFDGRQWWIILSETDFDWREPSDSGHRDADQRTLDLPPPRDWRLL